VQWGTEVDGQFEPIYGLESGLNREESLYYLAAAGLCEIKGQYKLGQGEPIEPPTPSLAVPALVTAPETSAVVEVQVPVEKPQINPVWEIGSPLVIGGVALGVLGLVVFAVLQQRNTKRTDTTPKPDYGSNPFGGE
jgi:hypothetical protein